MLHKYSSSLSAANDVVDICPSKIFTVSENITVKVDCKVHYDAACNSERTCSLTNSILAIRKAMFHKFISFFLFSRKESSKWSFIDELIEFWGKHSILTLFVRDDRVALWLWMDQTRALLGCHWEPELVSRAVIHHLFEITLAWASNDLLS